MNLLGVALSAGEATPSREALMVEGKSYGKGYDAAASSKSRERIAGYSHNCVFRGKYLNLFARRKLLSFSKNSGLGTGIVSMSFPDEVLWLRHCEA